MVHRYCETNVVCSILIDNWSGISASCRIVVDNRVARSNGKTKGLSRRSDGGSRELAGLDRARGYLPLFGSAELLFGMRSKLTTSALWFS